jgi:hypothetical protein
MSAFRYKTIHLAFAWSLSGRKASATPLNGYSKLKKFFGKSEKKSLSPFEVLAP